MRLLRKIAATILIWVAVAIIMLAVLIQGVSIFLETLSIIVADLASEFHREEA